MRKRSCVKNKQGLGNDANRFYTLLITCDYFNSVLHFINTACRHDSYILELRLTTFLKATE
jgi:hypothetical protein